MGEVTLSRCAHCGTPIREGVRHPTYTMTDEDGNVSLYVFCDDDCKAAWLETVDE
jgi:hypothetical protein